jgi:hypothetical protein
MKQTVHASYNNPDNAARAVAALMDHGVPNEDISIYIKNPPAGWTNFREQNGGDVMKTAEQGLTTTTSQDAASGAMKGAGVGLGVGILAALAAVTLPGIGLVLGGGALATALAGTAATTAAGAIAGSAVGYLGDQGVNPETATRISSTVDAGGALVSVTAPSAGMNHETIEAILAKYEATDIVIPTMTPIREHEWQPRNA